MYRTRRVPAAAAGRTALIGAALLVALTPLLAGCLTGPEAPPPSAERNTPGEHEATSPFHITSNATHKTYELDAAGLSFTDEFHTFTFVAHGPANVTIIRQQAIAYRDRHDGCIGMNVILQDAQGTAERAWIRTWLLARGQHTELAIGDQEASVQEPQPAASSIRPGLGFGSFNLEPGERLVVHLGGSSDEILNPEPGAASLNVTLVTRGDVAIEEHDQYPIRCGYGPHQASGGPLYASTGLPDVVPPLGIPTPAMLGARLGGEITMETSNATSLAFLSRDNGAALKQAHVEVLGERHESPGFLFLNESRGGTSRVIFDHWAYAGLPGPAWLLADADWPFGLAGVD